MNKVVTISLSGRAYQLEEAGYDQLRKYLDDARAKLAGNPDVEEIMRDLEAAIAEKLSAKMASHENVASASQVAAAIEEMGPVAADGVEAGATPETETRGTTIKRLYRLEEDRIIFGVCSGLGAYFGIDPVLVRIGFVALTILTGGGWIVVYIIMAIIIPKARTAEEVATAHGIPVVTAQELINRARAAYDTWDKRAWREHRRQWKRQMKDQQRAMKYSYKYDYHHHHCRPSLVGEIFQLLFIALLIWAIYHFIPGTDPFFNHVWALIKEGWQWIFSQLAK